MTTSRTACCLSHLLQNSCPPPSPRLRVCTRASLARSTRPSISILHSRLSPAAAGPARLCSQGARGNPTTYIAVRSTPASISQASAQPKAQPSFGGDLAELATARAHALHLDLYRPSRLRLCHPLPYTVPSTLQHLRLYFVYHLGPVPQGDLQGVVAVKVELFLLLLLFPYLSNLLDHLR